MGPGPAGGAGRGPEHARPAVGGRVCPPLFLLLAAVGGVLDRPTGLPAPEHITATADAISQASDLSARVAVPPGGNEFSRLAATFNQMFARLEQSFEAETQFTADASHELRTPVSVIKSACEYGETMGRPWRSSGRPWP